MKPATAKEVAQQAGVRRNPWNEVECGHHYARSMSNWALLLALSGFHCAAAAGALAFTPAVAAGDCRCFFGAGTAWGRFAPRQGADVLHADLVVEDGRLELQQISLKPAMLVLSAATALNGAPLAPHLAPADGAASLGFDLPVTLRGGDSLRMRLAHL
jgi:hypothetical protein